MAQHEYASLPSVRNFHTFASMCEDIIAGRRRGFLVSTIAILCLSLLRRLELLVRVQYPVFLPVSFYCLNTSCHASRLFVKHTAIVLLAITRYVSFVTKLLCIGSLCFLFLFPKCPLRPYSIWLDAISESKSKQIFPVICCAGQAEANLIQWHTELQGHADISSRVSCSSMTRVFLLFKFSHRQSLAATVDR